MLGRIRRVVVDSAGVVVDMGRTQRLFNHNARTAATMLTTHCTHPGCTLPATWCDIDHADEWARDNGRTDQANADIRCNTHNVFKHQHRWRTRTDTTGRPYSIRADNTIVLPVGERPPDLTIDETNRQAPQRLTPLRPAGGGRRARLLP
jgi:hypothetical protein